MGGKGDAAECSENALQAASEVGVVETEPGERDGRCLDDAVLGDVLVVLLVADGEREGAPWVTTDLLGEVDPPADGRQIVSLTSVAA